MSSVFFVDYYRLQEMSRFHLDFHWFSCGRAQEKCRLSVTHTDYYERTGKVMKDLCGTGTSRCSNRLKSGPQLYAKFGSCPALVKMKAHM